MGTGGADWLSSARTLVRWSPIILALGALGFALAPAIAEALPVRSPAQATIAITEESNWPFHEANMLRMAGALDDGELIAQAEQELGLATGTLDVRGSDRATVTQSTMRVDVSADDPQAAADGANRLAELMLAREPEVPVEIIDRAEPPSVVNRSVLAATGGFLGLLLGLAVVPAFDRTFGRLRRTDHPEFAGRVSRWVDTTDDGKGLLPLADRTDRLVRPLRSFEGPIAVIGAASASRASDVAKTLTSELSVEVHDGGVVSEPEATESISDASSVVLVLGKGELPRRKVDALLRRLDAIGSPLPIVMLVEKN